jgi:hypothetical protein
VSAIILLHSIIRAYSDPFFDAEQSAPIGKLNCPLSACFCFLISFSRKETPSRKYSTTRD